MFGGGPGGSVNPKARDLSKTIHRAYREAKVRATQRAAGAMAGGRRTARADLSRDHRERLGGLRIRLVQLRCVWEGIRSVFVCKHIAEALLKSIARSTANVCSKARPANGRNLGRNLGAADARVWSEADARVSSKRDQRVTYVYNVWDCSLQSTYRVECKLGL